MDLPKILLTGLVFFGFFGFPRVFGQLGLGQQKPREKPNKTKKQKKNNPEWTYPRFFSQDWFFWFFWFLFSSSFWTIGLGRVKKTREKQKKKQKKQKKKTILHGLTQDSSHRIVFFVFFCFP